VLYEVLRVSEQVSVILWSYPKVAKPGGPRGPRPPHFYFWGGLPPPLFA